MILPQFVRVLLAIFASLSCQASTSLHTELSREYEFSTGESEGTLFLGKSGRFVFESERKSCLVGRTFPTTYTSGIWELREGRIFLNPVVGSSQGGLHVIRSGRGFVLADDRAKSILDRQLERWGAFSRIGVSDFRSSGVKTISDEQLSQIVPPAMPASPDSQFIPATPGRPGTPSAPMFPPPPPSQPKSSGSM